MSPHRRGGSRYWQVAPRVTLPGRGRLRLPARSSGSTSRAVAAAMSRTLTELPAMGYVDLLERYVEDPSLTPAELHAAKLAGRLEDVRRRIDDPELVPLLGEEYAQVASLVARVRDARGERGVPRLSWLLDGANIRAVLEAREAEGLKRNSVRRTTYRQIGRFLEARLGRTRKAAVVQDVRFCAEDDTRHVFLRPEEIEELLFQAIGPLFQCALQLMLGSGIDVTPLLRIRPRHFEDPVLHVQDTKTGARLRAVELGPVAAAALRRAVMISGAAPDVRVWPWSRQQLWRRFHATVRRAKLDRIATPDDRVTSLRLKDLRGVFATYWLRAGGDPRELQRILGHTRIETTLRYIKSLPVGQSSRMADVEARQGLRVLGIDRRVG